MTDGRRALDALLERYASVNKTGFKISLVQDVDAWDAAIKEFGIQKAYDYLADRLCERYAAEHGEAFLFSNRCVAYEIEYHVDAYMACTGHKGYPRNLATFVFSRQALQKHCGVVDIGTEDVRDWKQRRMFHYRDGIRAEYKWTDRDPFCRNRTLSLFGIWTFKIKTR